MKKKNIKKPYKLKYLLIPILLVQLPMIGLEILRYFEILKLNFNNENLSSELMSVLVCIVGSLLTIMSFMSIHNSETFYGLSTKEVSKCFKLQPSVLAYSIINFLLVGLATIPLACDFYYCIAGFIIFAIYLSFHYCRHTIPLLVKDKKYLYYLLNRTEIKNYCENNTYKDLLFRFFIDEGFDGIAKIFNEEIDIALSIIDDKINSVKYWNEKDFINNEVDVIKIIDNFCYIFGKINNDSPPLSR